jgi:branched-chain amino acid transport system permease protein
LLLALFLLQFALPAYDHTNMTRIMLLAAYAVGYNILIGYTGLLSLGHAMFFAAGLYGAGLGAQYLGLGPPGSLAMGVAGGCLLAVVVGLVALRTTGVSFMIVTLMFAQACYLLILYFNEFTRGDEGILLAETMRRLDLGWIRLDFIQPELRYNLALAIFGISLLGCLMLLRSPIGRVLIAIRENPERARLLGYDIFRYKLFALAVSGAMAGAAGAAFALMFGYVGATYASIQYSILVLLWVLLGGAGTTIGPLVGTLLMFYLVETASEYTSSYNLVVGVILVFLVLFFPRGIMGWLRDRVAPWLP